MKRLAFAALALSLAFAGAALAQTSSHARKMNGNPDTSQARRITKALNLLEAKGYGDFTNFRADGSNYQANIVSGGQPLVVTIDPDSGQVTQG